jgi:hypothetical protein
MKGLIKNPVIWLMALFSCHIFLVMGLLYPTLASAQKSFVPLALCDAHSFSVGDAMIWWRATERGCK